MVIMIPAVFYSYTAITGESIPAVDIATFVVAVIIGQLASLKLFKYKFPRSTEEIAVIALILLAIVFVLFTFYPPHLPIFQDSITGRYGI
jgi:uncharacterized membrane protein YcaP (DUF421 family)